MWHVESYVRVHETLKQNENKWGKKKKQTGIFLCEGSKRTVLKFRYALFIHHSQKQKIEHPTQQRFV